MPDRFDINIPAKSLKDLDRRLEFADLKVARSLSGKGIRAAARAAREGLKASAPTSRIRSKFRTGRVSLFRTSRKGNSLPRARGGFASVAIGIPSPTHTPPDRNRRAYFIGYSYEFGFPGKSGRARSRKRYRRQQNAKGPFILNSVSSVGSKVVNAFLSQVDGLP